MAQPLKHAIQRIGHETIEHAEFIIIPRIVGLNLQHLRENLFKIEITKWPNCKFRVWEGILLLKLAYRIRQITHLRLLKAVRIKIRWKQQINCCRIAWTNSKKGLLDFSAAIGYRYCGATIDSPADCNIDNTTAGSNSSTPHSAAVKTYVNLV